MQFYTVEKAAEIMSVSAYMVRKWLRDGNLKGHKIGAGRLWRVTDDAIREFVEKNGQNAAS